MGKYLTRKNIGYAFAIVICILMTMGAMAKMFGSEEGLQKEMQLGTLFSWIRIIGIGEIISIALFLIPRTMKLGTVLLSAYFGGAIMFHMLHPNPENTAFTGAAVYLILIWVISWIRGNELIDLKSNNA